MPLVIKAFDIDSGLNALLHYDIVEAMPRRYFHIDSTTGAIKTVMLLDHEKIPLFIFHVKVSVMIRGWDIKNILLEISFLSSQLLLVFHVKLHCQSENIWCTAPIVQS